MQEQWPAHLPKLYPHIEGGELCDFLSDEEHQRIMQFPIVQVFPFYVSDGEKKVSAFGAGLARLMIRDLMLVRNISVRGPEDTWNVGRDKVQEVSLNTSNANTICIGGEFSTASGFRLEYDLWKNGQKIDQFTVSDSDFASFLLMCAESLAASVGGELTPELRQQWSVSRPLKSSSLIRLGLIRLAHHNEESEEKNRAAKKAISEDPNFGLLYTEIAGEDHLKACLKAYELDPYDAQNCFILFIATGKSNGAYEPYAVQFLRKAIELSPGHGKAHMCAPHSAHPSYQPQMIVHSELGYLLLPGNSFAVTNYLSNLERVGGPPEQLIELAKQGISDSPDDPSNYLQLIGFLGDQYNYEEALVHARILQEELYEPEISPRALYCLKQNPESKAMIESGEHDPRQHNLDMIQAMEKLLDENAIIYQTQTSLFGRTLIALLPMILLWVALFIGLVSWFQFVLLPDWEAPDRGDLATMIASSVTGLCLAWRFCWQIYGVVIRLNSVEVKRVIPCPEFAMQDLQCIAAMGGLDLSGGDLMIWKRNILCSDQRALSVKLGVEENQEIYNTLLKRNPKLAGIPYPIDRIDRPEMLSEYLPRVHSIYSRSAVIKLLVGLFVLLVCIGICYATTQVEKAESVISIAPYLIVGFVAVIFLITASIREFMFSRKVKRYL